MAEDLSISKGLSKANAYQELIPQIKGFVQGENNMIANLSNICAAIKTAFDPLWVGFYLTEGRELVLGPFQGPVACTRIQFGKGVCGTAWEQNQTVVVDNVDEFEGHIACSSLSKSEIVIPMVNSKNEVWAVLDIDSEKLAHFDETDRQYLQEITNLIQIK